MFHKNSSRFVHLRIENSRCTLITEVQGSPANAPRVRVDLVRRRMR